MLLTGSMGGVGASRSNVLLAGVSTGVGLR